MDTYRTLNIEVDPNCDHRQSHTDTRVAELLRDLGACEPSIDWASRRRDQSPQALWETCDRADWLAWYLGKLGTRDGYGSPAHRRAVLIACLCARTASHNWHDSLYERAVSLAERWAWGDETVTLDDLHASAYVADPYAADAAAFVRGIAAAAYADAYADAAYSAALAAADAYANAAAARTAHLASLADLIRAAVPEVPL
jgi:hypothetical protein